MAQSSQKQSLSLNHSAQSLLTSFERLYADIQSVRKTLEDQDGSTLSLVHRIHKLEAGVARVLESDVARLREIVKDKEVLLCSILRENAALADQCLSSRSNSDAQRKQVKELVSRLKSVV